jgi:hypothetical protein
LREDFKKAVRYQVTGTKKGAPKKIKNAKKQKVRFTVSPFLGVNKVPLRVRSSSQFFTVV